MGSSKQMRPARFGDKATTKAKLMHQMSYRFADAQLVPAKCVDVASTATTTWAARFAYPSAYCGYPNVCIDIRLLFMCYRVATAATATAATATKPINCWHEPSASTITDAPWPSHRLDIHDWTAHIKPIATEFIAPLGSGLAHSMHKPSGCIGSGRSPLATVSSSRKSHILVTSDSFQQPIHTQQTTHTHTPISMQSRTQMLSFFACFESPGRT